MWYWDEGLISLLLFGGISSLFGVIGLMFALDHWFYRSVVDVSPRGMMVTLADSLVVSFENGLPRQTLPGLIQ